MGFITQAVGGVVNVVEGATGTQGSGAGDWTEQQAANAENAADEAAAAVVDAATDPATFTRLLLGHLGTGVGTWLSGGITRAGLPVPSPLDLASILRIGVSVVDLAARKIDSRAGQMLPAPVVEAGRRLAGVTTGWVTGGPAAAWHEIKTDVDGTAEAIALRLLGQRVGHPGVSASPAQTVVDTARRADDAREQLLWELRRAVAIIEAHQRLTPGGLPSLRVLPSRRADAADLRRLCALLAAAADVGQPMPPEVARHLARASVAAARAALLHSELLLWMQAIRRRASRQRAVKPR